MFADVVSSVRWGQVGVTVAVVVVVLMVHFAWLRPLQRRAQSEAQKRQIDVRTTELQVSIGHATGNLLGNQLHQVDLAQLAVQAAILQAALREIAGPPALLQALQDLLDTTTKLADDPALGSSILQMTNACLAVEQRLSSLVLVATDQA